MAEPGVPQSFVRPARIADAVEIGRIQAKNMRRALVEGVAQLSPASLDLLDSQVFAQAWRHSIESPPSAKHHVLSALHQGKVVGFAALAPAILPEIDAMPTNVQAESEQLTDWETLPDSEPPADRVTLPESGEPSPSGQLSPLFTQAAEAEIIAFEIEDWAQPVGHEGRLINACGDILRKTGAKRVQTWINSCDSARIRFFSECGFVPAGLRQILQVGQQRLIQNLWFTDLKD